MEEMKYDERHVATGHYDCCGDMICRHDTVMTAAGACRVLWVGAAWLLWFGGHRTEKLNEHQAKNLRRM